MADASPALRLSMDGQRTHISSWGNRDPRFEKRNGVAVGLSGEAQSGAHRGSQRERLFLSAPKTSSNMQHHNKTPNKSLQPAPGPRSVFIEKPSAVESARSRCRLSGVVLC